MNSGWHYALLTVMLIGLELVYFWWAKRTSVLDKPTSRGSHQTPTIRGGGVVVVAAAFLWWLSEEESKHWLMLGLSGVATISFMDDMRPQPALLRALVHVVAVGFLFFQVPFTGWSWVIFLMAFTISVGSLSAFNFMDGINGITGSYAIVSLLTFLYIHVKIIPFTSFGLIILLLIGVAIFLFFNFRKQAYCFAGDVGSISIAYLQVFMMLQLIQETQSLLWVLIFLVFGTDSVITILYRIRRKENIFQPHRTHLYQFLSNEWRLDHRVVSLLYAILQMAINALVIFSYLYQLPLIAIIAAILYSGIYLAVRYSLTSQLVRIR